jgi:hypothetical protein
LTATQVDIIMRPDLSSHDQALTAPRGKPVSIPMTVRNSDRSPPTVSGRRVRVRDANPTVATTGISRRHRHARPAPGASAAVTTTIRHLCAATGHLLGLGRRRSESRHVEPNEINNGPRRSPPPGQRPPINSTEPRSASRRMGAATSPARRSTWVTFVLTTIGTRPRTGRSTDGQLQRGSSRASAKAPSRRPSMARTTICLTMYLRRSLDSSRASERSAAGTHDGRVFEASRRTTA